MKNAIKLICNCFISLIIVCLLFVIVINFFSKGDVCKVGKYSFFDVCGKSMEPKIKNGDFIAEFGQAQSEFANLKHGPILVNDGVRCDPDTYYLGEIIDNYPRVALCQKDELHYIVVTANAKLAHRSSINIRTFTDEIEKLHCQKAYTLDGGRTGTVVINGKVVNPIVKSERWISDTIYFATAIPSAEDVPVPSEP